MKIKMYFLRAFFDQLNFPTNHGTYGEIVELVPEPPVPLPRHHPDVSPLVPEGLGARVLDSALALAHAGTAETTVSLGIRNKRFINGSVCKNDQRSINIIFKVD